MSAAMIFRLALRSLWARRGTALLAALSIALSAALLATVEKMRESARESFAGVISDTDLIIGARAGGVQLMLYSVFRLGNATNNVTWESYEDIAALPTVSWIVPLSLGDSHRGFRVLGTTDAYFDQYRFRRGQALRFAEGDRFDDLFDAVIGAEVADRLGYVLGQEIVVAHGLGRAELELHDDLPFRVAGILARTGTPVDRTVHVSLEAIEAIHVGWEDGARPRPGAAPTAEALRAANLQPKAITAALVGLETRRAVFDVQRFVNEYREEPLTAVLPGIALQELWSVVGVAETALAAVSLCVVAAAALGMATMLLATLNERRREMAILRSVGAPPLVIGGLLVAEAALITLAGVALGGALHYGLIAAAGARLDEMFGLALSIDAPSARQWTALGTAAALGIAAGLPPAVRAYRLSVADGVSLRH